MSVARPDVLNLKYSKLILFIFWIKKKIEKYRNKYHHVSHEITVQDQRLEMALISGSFFIKKKIKDCAWCFLKIHRTLTAFTLLSQLTDSCNWRYSRNRTENTENGKKKKVEENICRHFLSFLLLLLQTNSYLKLSFSIPSNEILFSEKKWKFKNLNFLAVELKLIQPSLIFLINVKQKQSFFWFWFSNCVLMQY